VATPNVRDLLFIPGRLSVNPSNLNSAYPHGGTGLGLTRGLAIKLNSVYDPEAVITQEERGGEISDFVHQGEGAVLSCVLHSWDAEALNRLFPNTAAGAVTQKRQVSAPGSVRAGARASSRSVVLVFTPDSPDHHPMFILRRALPALQTSNEINLRLDREAGIAAIFVGIRDTSGRLYDFGMRHDLTT
jgi:hypothetical protein